MMDASHDRVLITISAHPSLEEAVVDWLLEHEWGPGFTSFDIRGHSARHEHLTVAEQVSGRQRRMRFEVVVGSADFPRLVEHLEHDFAGADAHYWVTPVMAFGSLDPRLSAAAGEL